MRIYRQTAELDREIYADPVRIWVEQEPGSGGKDAIVAVVKLLTGFRIRGDRVTGSKDVRLGPFADQAQGGNVYLVRGSWNVAYIDELCAVPSGRWRDQADASAGAFNKLARRIPGITETMRR